MLVRKNILNEINKEGTFTQVTSIKNRRPVPRKLKEKLMEHFRGSKIKLTKY